MDLKTLHKRHVLTPWVAQGGHEAPVVVRGEGVWLYDREGRRYLDLSAGLVAVNLGHAHPKLVRAIAEQAARLAYAAPGLFHDGRALLGKALSDLAPWPEGGRVFFTPSGTEANEDALKFVRHLTGRPKVLAAYRSFHGATHASASLTGENRRWPAEPGVPGVVHFFAPYPYRSPFFTEDPKEEAWRALEHLERVLLHEDPQRVAAIFLEPVVGSNGVIVYPEGYLEGVRALCDRHGILLVFDEVMTGFGRVGAAFAAERFRVVPDLITFAKGVTSAYVPLGGVLVREGLARFFDEHPLPTGHTYSGHPLAVAAGLAALEAYREEGIFARVRSLEGFFREALASLVAQHPLVGEVRGLGAFYALELVKDRKSKEPLSPWHAPPSPPMRALLRALLGEGVYLMAKHNVLLVAPPLTIREEEFLEGVERLSRALWQVEVEAL
ncbi:aminotransferase class III-fold pyridoxal phosphate-dependent enzyme [Thermus thermamylovorans]|uniref:Aminotransferase class III-fold pyridoxal phosphate-dependent enzyme n=1 Tax=Thermus thermamylovorans TaxID=2509362 RepID=A0A4Q9B5P4_9DEIN|nr:aminotransferase class III-fold pyridoxal phosphate-dependent enzyme [Thermus thermamylovorans]TBH20946.1 aminotransferase class III-fold pyridoxal phosphate-dependent enzyme [Thermus thermamylovorans]